MPQRHVRRGRTELRSTTLIGFEEMRETAHSLVLPLPGIRVPSVNDASHNRVRLLFAAAIAALLGALVLLISWCDYGSKMLATPASRLASSRRLRPKRQGPK
jgi:hypothetical protein